MHGGMPWLSIWCPIEIVIVEPLIRILGLGFGRFMKIPRDLGGAQISSAKITLIHVPQRPYYRWAGATNVNPRITWSIKRWKVWAAFRRPNGIAVLGMSEGSTGIWWYARNRSTFEKIVTGGCEVLNVWNGIPIRDSSITLCAVHGPPQGRQYCWAPYEGKRPNYSTRAW